MHRVAAHVAHRGNPVSQRRLKVGAVHGVHVHVDQAGRQPAATRIDALIAWGCGTARRDDALDHAVANTQLTIAQNAGIGQGDEIDLIDGIGLLTINQRQLGRRLQSCQRNRQQQGNHAEHQQQEQRLEATLQYQSDRRHALL